MRNNLLEAIRQRNKHYLEGYLETISLDALIDDLNELIDSNNKGDLKAFTKAAMQGLCALPNKSDEVFANEDEAWAYLGKISVKIAKATLSELQKQQS